MTEPAPSSGSAQVVGAPSRTQLESATSPSEPAGHIDIVPDSHVVFPPKQLQSLKPSTATAKEMITKGIYSDDRILDQNADNLWRLLVSNLQKLPQMAVYLSGFYTVAGFEGDSIVTDFCLKIDVSKYVIPQGAQIVAHSSCKASIAGQGTPMPTVRETLQEYMSSVNPFKEIRVQKFVVWDEGRVTQLLTDLVRATGYENDIEVSFWILDKAVTLASNKFSRAAHSSLVQVLCVVSCLCILFCPTWKMERKRMALRLDCEYQMAVSADKFYARNRKWIQSAVVQRCQSEEFMDAL